MMEKIVQNLHPAFLQVRKLGYIRINLNSAKYIRSRTSVKIMIANFFLYRTGHNLKKIEEVLVLKGRYTRICLLKVFDEIR